MDAWGSKLFGLFAMLQAALLVIYPSIRFGMYFWGQPNVYWPAWVAGTWDVAAVPAAFALQAWWQTDPWGIPMWLMIIFVGPSMWLNIVGIVGASAGSTTMYSGAPTWMNDFNLTLTGGATPSFNTGTLEYGMLIVLVCLQGILVGLFVVWNMFDNEFNLIEMNERSFDGRAIKCLNCKPRHVTTDYVYASCFPSFWLQDYKVSSNWLYRKYTDAYCVTPLLCCIPFCGYYEPPEEEAEEDVEYTGERAPVLVTTPTTYDGKVSLKYAHAKNFRSPEQACITTIGVIGFVFILLLYIEYCVAEGSSLAPAVGLDSGLSLLIMALILSIFPIRRVGTWDNAEAVSCFGGTRQYNFMYAFVCMCLLWGMIIAFSEVNDQIATTGGKYFIQSTYPNPANVTTHGYRVVISGTGNSALTNQYRVIVQVCTFFLGLLAILSFLGHVAYANNVHRVIERAGERFSAPIVEGTDKRIKKNVGWSDQLRTTMFGQRVPPGTQSFGQYQQPTTIVPSQYLPPPS